MAAGEAEDVGGEGFRAAHDALLNDPTLQFDLDTAAVPPPEPPPDWIRAIADFIQFIAPALTYIFWAGLAVIAAFIVFAIVKEIAGRQWSWAKKEKPPPVEPATPQFRPTIERAKALLEEADRLAREGKFAEAVRIILHHSIDDMEQALATIIPPSMTSREIASMTQLSEQGRDVFSKIARAVELSLFGQRPFGQEQYFECRREYEAFVFGGAPT